MTDLFSQDVPAKLEALYTTSDVVAQREATITALRPLPGERILDVGSGPGLLALQLADRVAPNGFVTGIDLSADMVELAQSRCDGSTSGQRAAFLEGDASSLPFDDETFDAVVSTQVYEYVSELGKALYELYRVLRHGGRAVIVDTDWDSVIWHSDDRALMTQVMDIWKSRFVDPCLPRTLRRRLQEVGFVNQQTESLTILNTEYNDANYSVRHLPIMISFLVQNGLTGPDVIKWSEDLQRQGREDAYFFSLNRYLFVATKP